MKEEPDIWDQVTHGYAENDDVRIHYATLGSGPLIVMMHGFPDFWYTWRYQMAGLSEDYRVVSVDLRGYNKSDKPGGLENYTPEPLMDDIVSVIRHFDREEATLMANDWGGFIAWMLATFRPEVVENLIICNMPHPGGLMRELAENPEQRENSSYAREFQEEGAHEDLTAEYLADWVADEETRDRYVEALERSDFEATLNYYKVNYPREPYEEEDFGGAKVESPVLMFHGLEDQALLPETLDGTWRWVERELTLVTVPGAGHFVQRDAHELVIRGTRDWLSRRAV